MQARYGMDRRPVGAWIGTGTLVLAFVGALVFVALNVTGNPVEYRLVAWDVVAPDHVDVTLSVDKPQDAAVTCVIRAQDENRIDLGYATVELPVGSPSDLLTYPLRTLAPAFTVEVLGCAVGAAPGVAPPQFPPGVVAPQQPWSAT